MSTILAGTTELRISQVKAFRSAFSFPNLSLFETTRLVVWASRVVSRRAAEI
jgi:hypothetical protein